tara:strand:- start:378 stop:632 length:255 start_codon:yes stop_codon:yes gene_type:complete
MLSSQWHDSANDIVLIGAAVAVILGGLRGAYKATKFFQRLEATVTFVERELKPNGGGSMRDAIDKLVHRTDTLEAVLRTRKETR